jgi:hypothetical protein
LNFSKSTCAFLALTSIKSTIPCSAIVSPLYKNIYYYPENLKKIL